MTEFLNETTARLPVGEVPRYQQPVEGVDIGNGGPAPEWGVHITARDGMLHYGPWADRQSFANDLRGSMMKFFFPASHRNMKKTPCLKAGQTRVPTAIKIYIEFLSQTTVRVPLREASKNWKYARRSSNDDASELDDPMRPYGWIDLKASKDSWLKFVVPTVADDSGYSNTLLVELGGLDVVTSTNYASLLSAKRLKIEANMHNPLVWNSPRTWTFDFKFIRPQIYLLRDHLFLIQDLVKDWTAGSSTDLIHFVPTAYVLRITLDDFILNLCLEISLPVTHTLGAFLTEESSHCGSIVSFSLNGTYEFYSFLDPSHLESLTMFLKGSGATFKLFGFTVRYLLILRENYFGPFMNFSTLEEYRRRREHPEEARDIARRQAEAKAPSDPFEVFISLILEDGSLILPENLYDRANSSLIEFHELQLELRVLDVYLGKAKRDLFIIIYFALLTRFVSSNIPKDLYVNSSPLTWTREGGAMVRKEKFKMKNMKDTQNYLYIDGQVKPSFLLGIASFGKTFLYNMVDEDNALPSEFLTKLEPEVSFLQASVKEIDIALWGRQSATQVILKEGLNLGFDNLINEKYNSKVTLVLPQLTSDPTEHPWVDVAHLDSSLNVTIYRSTANWQDARRAQQNYIRMQDKDTRRCPFLYDPDEVAMESE
ncbi:hypothetical protein BC937DRAFT_94898 [Endogone sp. FLAS-F59071]|nr:hypothetical protein BC937DRAFT_94898 [Endogone sp. FLAS-F59071]|eukprot:RUS20577.1 hypothetical protein BC937DRAFT_94898 [Endogone sp. FLAS-F59071]